VREAMYVVLSSKTRLSTTARLAMKTHALTRRFSFLVVIRKAIKFPGMPRAMVATRQYFLISVIASSIPG
jgi:hypothetical protein